MVVRPPRSNGTRSGQAEAGITAPPDRRARARFRGYLRTELEAAGTYLALAAAERDEARSARLRELAAAEMRHARHWAERLGIDPGGLHPVRYGLKPSLVGIASRFLGSGHVVPWLVRGEMEDVRAYARDPEALEIAHEEKGHETALLEMIGARGPAERARYEQGLAAAGGGTVRAAVMGINDGLVSNLSLVMGVLGGTSESSVIVLAGAAGLLAGAFSMAAGEYVSVKSQRDVYERMIEIERAEIEQWPDEEEAELRDIYEGKGLTPDEAAAVAKRLMQKPEAALDAMVREELGLSLESLGSPWRAAMSSFPAFVIGAFIPLAPFIFADGGVAIGLAAALSAVALGLVGGAISAMASRNSLWGAARMMLAGLGASLVTFGLGRLIGVSIGG
ncbi:MAG: VIT1/CCC1 transporter family protein [Chloroflexi bacterium]|nr:VIT1/CCC1 transporter family protein [Chloroflexota bacterium]